MKKNIHPKYYEKAIIRCICGATFEVGSTREYTEVEICSHCHQFYTGKRRSLEKLWKMKK